MVQAQEYLDQNYPQSQRNTITELELYQKSLAGDLDCSDFVNLEELVCYRNNLTSLNLTSCDNLKIIICSENNLTEIQLPKGEKLEVLYLSNNKFHQDLSFLKDFRNLESLDLQNNNFYGGLEYLKDLRKLEDLDIRDTDIDSGLEYLPESIEKFYCLADQRKDAKVKVIYNLFANEKGEVETDYGRIKSFSQKLKDYKQKIEEWKKHNFTSEEIEQWISAGAKWDDYRFAIWLKNTKNLTPKWITAYKEDYQILGERFKKYGLCPECKNPNTGEKWCQPCNKSRLETMALPASNNPEIDKFIQKYQLAATDADKFIEWIPYEQFTDIEYLAQGGFGEVYKAKWSEGNIDHWDVENNQWNREKDEGKDSNRYYKKYQPYREIVLKSLNNSQANTDFLQETEKHKIIDDWFNNIVPCYGLSQDPKTGNYLMVMQYMPEGNLRNYLSNKNKELTLEDKLGQLHTIAQGLKDIHAKNLVHRDFHSGNILKGIEKTSCLITDLGLCKPANEISKEDKIFGVMPYVAPEVLRSQPYTQVADIYSFGIIAYEILSGLPPYYDVEHDLQLALAICQGQRPQFQIKIPQLLEDLIKKRWNTDPDKRPTASELEKILKKWQKEIKKGRSYYDYDLSEGEYDSAEELNYRLSQKEIQFQRQLREAEEYNKTLPNHIKYPDYKKKMHSGAVYHSRLLPTKEISRILSQNQEASGSIYIKDTSDLESCVINIQDQQAQIQQAETYGTPGSSR